MKAEKENLSSIAKLKDWWSSLVIVGLKSNWPINIKKN